jgi:hypothetical protein
MPRDMQCACLGLCMTPSLRALGCVRPRPLCSRSLPVSFLFVANVSAAFYGLQLIDVPLFLCVRRLTSLCVLVTEFVVLGKVSSRPVMVSILLVMAGTILAGYESLSSYFVGYIYVMMNNILTALLYTWVRDVAGEGPVQAPGASARCGGGWGWVGWGWRGLGRGLGRFGVHWRIKTQHKSVTARKLCLRLRPRTTHHSRDCARVRKLLLPRTDPLSSSHPSHPPSTHPTTPPPTRTHSRPPAKEAVRQRGV